MPFENGQWTDPTAQDIEYVHASILNPPVKAPKKANPLASPEVQDTIANIVDDVIEHTSETVNSEVNNRVYKQHQSIGRLTGKKVDIILPVYNAIHLTEECIRVLYARTSWPFELYVVDDASDNLTKKILGKLQKKYKFNLITNKKNHGFAASVNTGVKASNNPYIVLLNSDVLVTDNWLTKMLIALEDDERNQIVNPATNNTAEINVHMWPGYSYIAMNKAFEAYSRRRYPEIMPTGFLYLMRRDLFKKLGYFSPSFTNFGEETDSFMRTKTYHENGVFPHYRAVMADDTYVFHQRSVSFSSLGEEENMKLRQRAAARFRRLWPQFQQIASKINVNKELNLLRAPMDADHLNHLTKPNYRICWLVHSVEMCGGLKYITDIVNEINEKGGDARIALVKRRDDMPVKPISELRIDPVVFNSYQDVIANFTSKVFSDGIVVASTVELAPIVTQLVSNTTTLKPLLHVQSYEPDMVDDAIMKQAMEVQFKLIPNVIVNSGWVADKLKNELGVSVIKSIVPGIDNLLFYPRGREAGDDRPTVMVAVRKGYHFKGYDRAVALIKTLSYIADKNNFEVRIMAYGADDIPEAQEAVCVGALSQVRLAVDLGKEVDVFIDPSTIHSYGLPALEALASGCAVVSWDNKGVNEYIVNNKNGVIFPQETAVDKVAVKILQLLADAQARKELTMTRADTMKVHDRRKSVAEFISTVQKHFGIPDKKKIFVVAPHFRKHGGPTTILDMAQGLKEAGHTVMLGSTYADIELDVIKQSNIPIHIFDYGNLTLPDQAALVEARIPECDIIISNSDNPLNSYFVQSKKAAKKIMLKLSHNERFKELETLGLNQPWDAILASSEWVKNTCTSVTPNWTYTPYSAEKVFRIGWSHYSHDTMNNPPIDRDYASADDRPIVVSTLIHNHPSKGTMDALYVLEALYKVFGNKVKFFGVGEIPSKQLKINLANFEYCYAPSREGMAELLATSDIWFGASHTEGLGRMALEAMSASAACVITDTGAEYAVHGQNCLIVPVGGKLQMADALGKLVTDADLRRQISVAGYETAIAAAMQRADVIKKIGEAISYVY